MTTDDESPKGTIAAIAKLTRETGQPFMLGGIPSLLVPDGSKLERHDDLAKAPIRIKQEVTCDTADAFIAYAKRFYDDTSMLFCDIKNGEFLAKLDYHDTDGWSAGWCQHSVRYVCPLTPEWMAWNAASGEWKQQEAFAEFIVDNQEEIIDPPGAQMLELAQSLQAKKDVNFASGIRLANGEIKLRYEETISGTGGIKGDITIPEVITIGLAPLHRGIGYRISARFRYRIKDGKLLMRIDLIRPHKTHEAAVLEVAAHIKTELSTLPSIDGRPDRPWCSTVMP